MVIGTLRRRTLSGDDAWRFLRPALIHGLEAPLGALFRSANRPFADQDENRVRMGRAENTERNPAASLNRNVERQITQRAVRREPLRGHRMAVDDHLDGDVARCGNPRVLGAPLRLHTTGRGRTGCRLGQQACGLHRRSQHSGPLESQFAPVRAGLHTVDGEIHQMTEPVGHIRTADAHTFAPPVVGQRLRQMNVRAASSNARISDTWEIGFAADPVLYPQFSV